MYSPPRVTAAAGKLKNLGITPGFALDLTTTDEHGVAWDFDCKDRRREARRRLELQKPMILLGTPMCTKLST